MFPLWTVVIEPYITNVPWQGDDVGWEIFFGGFLGLMLGGIIGTFAGALCGALARKFQPAASVSSTELGLGASL